jgi:hypothetical protein
MTAEKLYGMLKFLDMLDTKLSLQKSLEAIVAALTNLVSSPAHPQYQSDLATALSTFETAADKLGTSITPSQYSAIKEIGGEEFFEPKIADRVKVSIQTNAMTPSVAKDFVQELATKRSTFLASVRGARQNLEKLGIKESPLQPNTADIAFLIPRDIFDNQLGSLAKELTFISRLMQDFNESLTGDAEHVEVEQLSSSVPTVTLMAAAGVISVIGTVINKFLEAWEKIEQIRRLRGELTEMGMRGAAVEELTEQITTTVDEVVEESTKLVIENYKGNEGRKQELDNAVRQDTRRLFGQIERGLTVEIRAGAVADKGADDTQKAALEAISNLSKTLEFPTIAREPILLGNGEILEGEIIKTIKTSKKTTVHKTVTSKKETHKNGKQDS